MRTSKIINFLVAKNFLFLKILGGVLFLLFAISEADSPCDFRVFYYAAIDLMAAKKDIYTYSIIEGGYNYFYGTLFAILIYPFTFFSIEFVTFLWLILNGFFLIRCWKHIKKWLGVNEFSEQKRLLFFCISLLFSLGLIKTNLHYSQVTILIIFCVLEAFHQFEQKRKIGGSALLGFGIMVKLLPLVIVPYLFYRRMFTEGVLSIGFIALFYCAPMPFVGTAFTGQLLNSQFSALNVNNERHVLDVEESDFHSVGTWITTLLKKDISTTEVSIRRHIIDAPYETIKIVQNTVRLVIILTTLLIIRFPPFKKVKNQRAQFYEVSFLLLVTPLIFPHQQIYSYLFVVPSFVYSLYYIFTLDNKSKPQRWRIVMLSIAFVLCAIYYLVGDRVWTSIYNHYKFLVYGSFILMALMVISHPNKLKGVN